MPRDTTTPHTVHLFNYTGEVDDVAQFQECIIEKCYCDIKEGASNSSSGKKSADTATLYIFKHGSRIRSPSGVSLEFVPAEAWMTMQERIASWTINPNGKDYFTLEGNGGSFRVSKCEDNGIGSRRVQHYKVVGK